MAMQTYMYHISKDQHLQLVEGGL